MNDVTSSSSPWQKWFIAAIAIALSLALVLGIKTQTPAATLESQAAQSTAMEVALSNGKPTMLEFYADWCTSCQAMAQDLANLKKNYRDRLNFVMLNVDNSRWLPEVLKYRVDGIPHFVFFDQDGQAIAETIGEQPRTILEANADALIAKTDLPYTYQQGQVSKFKPTGGPSTAQDDPRSHGAQVNPS